MRNKREKRMQAVKIIGVFGLIVGLAGQSHAGFRDALKAAAGSALNEVAGTANVTNLVSGQTSAEDAKSLTSDSVVNAAPAEIKNCVTKDGSSTSKESFMKANNFLEADYIEWMGEVTKQLASYQNSGGDKWLPVSGIPVEGIIQKNFRITLPPDEASKVFCVVENDGIFLAQEYAYILSGTDLIKFNYATLAAGSYNERDVSANYEAGKVIYAIQNCCNAAKQKISSQKAKQAELAAQIEREKIEAAEAQEREQQRNERAAQLVAAKAEKERAAAQQQEESQKQIQAILAWDDSSAKAKAANMKNKTIVFKSFYLGMPPEDAYKLIYRALNGTIMSQMGGHEALDICARGAISIGSADEVIAINLNAIVVNALFSADKQDASEFVETFRKAYGIPKMRISDDWSSWTYTSPDGARLTIDAQKNLLLEKVASKEDQKKNFD
jgi:hypothetical protein